MSSVIIHEVGMRDGLQMEKQIVPLEVKLEWLRLLADSGVEVIQVGSFVHPKYVPQMADTDVMFQALQSSRPSTLQFSALVLNEKGLERGLACNVDLLCMGVSASETHSMKNTKMGTDEALTRIIAMARQALAAGRSVQVSVQSAFGCGFEGAIAQSRVERIVDRYLDAGLTNISLADTAGHADPKRVAELFETISRTGESVESACHFHDTYGMGLANCMAAIDAGVRTIEASFGGLGGCPFTKVAGGNVATEDLVHMLNRMGLRRDLKLEPLLDAASQAAAFFGRDLPGAVYKTGPIPDGPTVRTQG